MGAAHPSVGRKSGGRPVREEADRRLNRVLEIAQQHFLAAGFDGSSLDAIALEAGVAKKTLYHHFGSKTGLFAAILEALRESWIAELRNLTVGSGRPHSVLEAIALHTLDVGTRPDTTAVYRLLVTEASRFPDIVRDHYENGMARGMEPLADYLRRAAAMDELVLDDFSSAAEQFTYLVLGGLRTRMLLGVAERPGLSERRRMARQAVRIFLSGCLAEQKPRSGRMQPSSEQTMRRPNRSQALSVAETTVGPTPLTRVRDRRGTEGSNPRALAKLSRYYDRAKPS